MLRVPQVPAMPLLDDMPEAVKALEMKEREDPEEEFHGDELGELAPRTHLSTMMRRIGWLGSIMTRETQELARAFGFGAAVSRPVEQSPAEKKPVERKLLALMDHSQSDLGISAQKRSLLDDVPSSTKRGLSLGQG